MLASSFPPSAAPSGSSTRAPCQEPGHVRRRRRLGADHRPLPEGSRRPAAAISASRSRSSSGCGSPCCSPTSPKRSPKAAARRRPNSLRKARTETQAKLLTGDDRTQVQAGARHQPEGRRRRARRGRRHHPVGRRGDRRRRLGQRGGDHRRIRSGHPRIRRRPFGRDRRHAGAVRLDPRAHHGGGRLDLPRPHDRAGRRRRAPEDAQRDRAQHPARRHDADLRAGDGDDPELRHLCRRLRSRSSCSSRCS